MFALIETKNATHIAIHIPADKAHESMPALAKMLEQNATFIKQSWREMEVVTPAMSIVLGNSYDIQDNEGEALKVAEHSEVIGSEFVADSPDVYRSNKVYREKKETEVTTMRREIDSLKLQVEKLQSALTAATAPEEADA
jgi:uncharacterized protein YaiE (UPF0345 family)